MEKIITKRKNGTLRVQTKTKGASKTDQSDKNMVNINNIMLQYQKTGLLPQFKEKVTQYIDTTQIPSYMEAQAQIREAKSLFEQLPSQVRKLMQNNPENLEKVLENPDYTEMLIKYGILDKKEAKPVAKQEQAKPAAKAKSDDKKE